MEEENIHGVWAPAGAPLYGERDDEYWRQFDNSVNAISFGFVATAILISMFLFMAIFERFLRPNHSPDFSQSGDQTPTDIESQMARYNPKLSHPSRKIHQMATEISVLMPGEDIPTFIAQPAPVACPPQRIPWPPHHHPSSSIWPQAQN